MLIWKASSLNISLASLRYRCLIPLHYLELCGYKSCIYSNCDGIKFNDHKSDVMIFVKSFKREDLELAKKAHKLGVPVILDICDNIFIEEYTTRIDNIRSAEIFKEMSKFASAIVTTGVVLKNLIKEEIGESAPIFIIPDGNETLEDVKQAMTFIKWTRWYKMAIYRPTSFLLSIKIVFKVKTIGLYKHFDGLIINFYKKNISGIQVSLNRLVKSLLKIEANKTTVTEQKFNVSKKQRTLNTIVPVTFSVKSKDINQQWIEKSNQLSKHSTSSKSSSVDVKRIIWFGHHGASYGNFGMLNILDIAEPLIKISNEINFTLLVVSNNYEKYSKHILPLPFSTEYIDWDPLNIYEYISQSDVTIVPNSKTPFSIGKSANRTVLSLSLGVPVVATETPALKIFQNCIMCDEWERGLRGYLTDHHLVNRHIELAQSIIKQNYSGEAIATQWANVINQVNRKVV